MNEEALYTLLRDCGKGATRDIAIGGKASLEEIIDAFRAMLVMMGYGTDVAARLVLLDELDSE